MKDCQFGVSPVNYSDSDSDSEQSIVIKHVSYHSQIARKGICIHSVKLLLAFSIFTCMLKHGNMFVNSVMIKPLIIEMFA